MLKSPSNHTPILLSLSVRLRHADQCCVVYFPLIWIRSGTKTALGQGAVANQQIKTRKTRLASMLSALQTLWCSKSCRHTKKMSRVRCVRCVRSCAPHSDCKRAIDDWACSRVCGVSKCEYRYADSTAENRRGYAVHDRYPRFNFIGSDCTLLLDLLLQGINGGWEPVDSSQLISQSANF